MGVWIGCVHLIYHGIVWAPSPAYKQVMCTNISERPQSAKQIYTATKKYFTTCLCVEQNNPKYRLCGQGRDGPSNLKNVDIFSYITGTFYANFQFLIKWSFKGGALKQKLPIFTIIEAPFYWKLLKIGIRSAKDIR